MNDKAVAKSDEVAQIIELRHKVDKNKPKADDIAEFRRGLVKFPDLWRAFGDMALQAEHTLIDAIHVPNSSREAMRLGVKSVKDDLGYASAPPLEKMLIDQVALCWLRLSIVEVKHATITSGSVGISQGDYWDRTLSAAQRRYMRAIETLARVRRLRKPNAVQVNIGAQQVNVASMAKKDTE
jgi:hypothetical protein